MNSKAAIVNARIEPKIKHEAENILHHLGLTSAEAIRLFYKLICLYKGLPFDVRIPNKKTRMALLEANSGKIHKLKNIEELFEDLD